MNMRKIIGFSLLLLLAACSGKEDTVKGNPDLLATNMLTTEIGGQTLFFLDNHDGTVSITYDQRNPMHMSKDNKFVLTDYVGEIEVPSSVTIDEKTYQVTGVTECAFKNNTTLTKVVLPETVTSIGLRAFDNCLLLEELSVPEGVSEIPDYCFNGCKALRQLDLPSHLDRIGEKAFKSCTKLEALEIPEGVTTIEEEMFKGFSAMTSLTLPSTVTQVGRQAFYGCSRLTAIEVPEGVTEIPDSAFAACGALVDVTLPETLTKLGEGAFASCRSLYDIVLPASVKEIGAKCFFSLDSNGNPNWNNLVVNVKSETPPTVTGSFVNQIRRRRVVIPRGTRDVYMQTDYWNEFFEAMETNY